MTVKSTPFPILMPDSHRACESGWPAIPVDGYHASQPIKGIPAACAIDTVNGTTVLGDMLDFEPYEARMVFRPRHGGRAGWLRFSSIRRLTLLDAVAPVVQIAGMPTRTISTARQARDYTLHGGAAPGAKPIVGRTVAHVETPAGLFLFAPADDTVALQRVFVPRSAYSECRFGLSAEEIAAGLWIGTAQALHDALARQDKRPVAPIGQSFLALGLLTPVQLERALARPADGLPLGEALVAARLISEPELLMAIAHKMGYPMVDLRRFPVDRRAVAMVPRERLLQHRILPLLQDGGRLVVAFDRLSRLIDLRVIEVKLERTLVPVLASGVLIRQLLERMSDDVWGQHAAGRQALVAH